jgi:hypothetical protein
MTQVQVFSIIGMILTILVMGILISIIAYEIFKKDFIGDIAIILWYTALAVITFFMGTAVYFGIMENLHG